MNSNRNNITYKGRPSSLIVSFALIGGGFLLATMALQSSPTPFSGDPIGADAFIVTTSDDVIAPDGKTSLREAITTANNQAGPDTITFNIPASEAGCTAANACTITLATELPMVTDNLTIDGLPNNGHITINGNHTVRAGFYVTSPFLNVQNLTLANGSATGSAGGAILIGFSSTVNAANITLMGNTAEEGGAVFIQHSPNFFFLGLFNVSNSTFFGNSASYGGGIYSDGMLRMTNCTFSSNSATIGGGILGGSTLTIKNSIIANNMGGDCSIVGSADSFNLDTDGTCGNATTKTAAEINLQPLADNGGPTMTIALQLPSAAVDTADNAVAAAPPVNNMDQRGLPRPIDGDSNGSTVADVGAFELESFSQCAVCHKRTQTLVLPCNGLDYRRHLDHGDPPNACTQLSLPASKSTRD